VFRTGPHKFRSPSAPHYEKQDSAYSTEENEKLNRRATTTALRAGGPKLLSPALQYSAAVGVDPVTVRQSGTSQDFGRKDSQWIGPSRKFDCFLISVGDLVWGLQ